MPATGEQLEQIKAAIKQAFSADSLRQLIQYELDQNPEDFLAGTGLDGAVYRLVQWADRQGRLVDLLRGAIDQNPGNVPLARTSQTLIAELEVDAPPSGDVSTSADLAIELRTSDVEIWVGEPTDVVIDLLNRTDHTVSFVLHAEGFDERWLVSPDGPIQIGARQGAIETLQFVVPNDPKLLPGSRQVAVRARSTNGKLIGRSTFDLSWTRPELALIAKPVSVGLFSTKGSLTVRNEALLEAKVTLALENYTEQLSVSPSDMALLSGHPASATISGNLDIRRPLWSGAEVPPVIIAVRCRDLTEQATVPISVMSWGGYLGCLGLILFFLGLLYLIFFV